MTPSSPTWSDLRTFLLADRWREIGSGERGGSSSDHVFFEKLLDDGRLLQTHVSHSEHKSLSAGRFSAILRHQLEVSRDEFWDATRRGEPVKRPVPLEPEVFGHPAWIVAVLVGKLHMDSARLAELSASEAEALVQAYWRR